MTIADWSPDSDYDTIKTNDPNGKMWAKVCNKLKRENLKETAEFFEVDKIIISEWSDDE